MKFLLHTWTLKASALNCSQMTCCVEFLLENPKLSILHNVQVLPSGGSTCPTLQMTKIQRQ